MKCSTFHSIQQAQRLSLQAQIILLESTTFIPELALPFSLVNKQTFQESFSQFLKIGHTGEISKVSFNPQGTKIITASADCTARVWSAETGEELQILEGHSDEIFSSAFNYEGDIIITGIEKGRKFIIINLTK